MDGGVSLTPAIGTDRYRRAGKTLGENRSVEWRLGSASVGGGCDLLRDPHRLQSSSTQTTTIEKPTSEAKQKAVVDRLKQRIDRLIDAYADGLLEP